ncbi:hypothetical protein C6P46_005552 [Rhodotorula mucilaginosa]|uniref:FAD/NAD(P)-binding domain-containing protein n=1 Tax=Rhodotorula mucilaginosa TaxID=5537 RepID=A0A9P6W0D4_RHOMI|nr:hypothetical protein C6P46_005552 [Rhodotorula mucilaginosa]TKA56619.1 hypothetical protein B0A53_01811 [Rhodotorula sp. CCFEE 5036]
MVAPSATATRNVLVLGCSYAGARAAKLLSETLPSSHRVVVIDRQSHFNHLYLQPRVSVVPGHAPKVFVPYQNVLGTPASSTAAATATAAAPPPLAPPKARHVFVSAAVTELHDGYVELDRDLLEHERDLEGDEEEVDRLTAELEHSQLEADGTRAKKEAARRLKWDYLIYALGCTLPPPLASVARTKKDGVSFLEAQQAAIDKASSILIVGGGALGIQYATDIADLYNNPANAAHLGEKAASPPRKKRITLVHSRDRFMPLYKQEVHDEVMRRMKELGVDVVLGERPDLGDVKDDKPGEKRILRLSDGREVEYDLLMRCTGQKPNSQLMRDFLPGVLDKHGYINVRDTLQVDLSRVPDQDRYSERVRRNLFAIGDVANAGVIKAGHTGWNQAGPAVQNIMCLIETDAANAALPPGAPLESPKLVEYERSPPQIKLTLGLGHSVSELLPSMDAKETVIKTASDGPVDGHWKVMWEGMGADPSDVNA